MSQPPYQLIVIGSGAAGMMAAITAAREGKKVLLLEKGVPHDIYHPDYARDTPHPQICFK